MRSTRDRRVATMSFGALLLLFSGIGAIVAVMLGVAGTINGVDDTLWTLLGLAFGWLVPLALIGVHLVSLRWRCLPRLDASVGIGLAVSAGVGGAIILRSGLNGMDVAGEFLAIDLAILGAGLVTLRTNRRRCDEA